LLDKLKTRAAAHQKDRVVERDPARQQGGADQFVHGIMAPDVLAYGLHLALRSEESRSVPSPGALESALLRAEMCGQMIEDLGGDLKVIGREDGAGIRLEIAERTLATYAAGRCHQKVALRLDNLLGLSVLQFDKECVFGFVAGTPHRAHL